MNSDHQEYRPGDLAVRPLFSRILGVGPDRIVPRLEITDMTSVTSLSIELTAQNLTEMFSGGPAEVPASKVQGFRALGRWGLYHQTRQVHVPQRDRDYAVRSGDSQAIRALPHLADAIKDLEAEGYQCDTPRRSNTGRWVITGRKYTVNPDGSDDPAEVA